LKGELRELQKTLCSAEGDKTLKRKSIKTVVKVNDMTDSLFQSTVNKKWFSKHETLDNKWFSKRTVSSFVQKFS